MSPKLTVLEGPDGGGKTTLAKAAFKHAHYEHLGPPPLPKGEGGWNPAFRQYATALTEAALRPYDTVFDRLMYGELIYGPLLRKDTSFELWHLRMLERVLLSYQGVVVWCIPAELTCLDTWRARREAELVDNEHVLGQIYAEYYHMSGPDFPSTLPGVRFSYEDADAFTTVEKFHAALDVRRPPLNQGPGLGMFKPGVTLLVGEQVNQRAAVNDAWPFVSGQGSSRWITKLLSDNNVPEDQLYWVNARRGNGLWTSPDFIQWLLPRRIIALGGTAKEWCHRFKLQHDEVPHPAYWSRFHSGEPENYPLLELL